MAPPPSIRRALALSVAGSLLAHGLALFAVSRASAPVRLRPRRRMVLVDIDTPPPPPPAAAPARAAAAPKPPVAPNPASAPRKQRSRPKRERRPHHKKPAAHHHSRSKPPPTPPKPKGAKAVAATHDAGAGAGVAAAPPRDGGIPIGAVAMAATAAESSGALAQDTGPSPFALAVPARDGGTADVALLGLPGAGATTPPPGSAADLRPFAPPGDRIQVLMRLDRLGGTDWERRARAILAPMPDYRAIVGDRGVALSDLFDVLLISSAHPSDVTATTLAARTAAGTTSIKRFLARPGAPIRWSVRWGGQLGRRTGAVGARDPRVYFVPQPRWVVLTRPKALAGGDGATAPWLGNLPALPAEAGDGASGPAIIVSAHDLPATVSLPRVGTLPCPRHVALAFDVADAGFVVRGTLAFAAAKRARRFVEVVRRARASLLGGYAGRLLLGGMHAYNAAAGLSLRRRDRIVTYATSISIADGRAMMKVAAAWSRRYFLRSPPPRGDK